MHFGGLTVAIQNVKSNFKYILINNGCHESVGKQPTISYKIDLEKIFKGFGFDEVIEVNNIDELILGIKRMRENLKVALIVNTNDKSRKDLERPTSTSQYNKEMFQNKLRSN